MCKVQASSSTTSQSLSLGGGVGSIVAAEAELSDAFNNASIPGMSKLKMKASSKGRFLGALYLRYSVMTAAGDQ